MTWPSPQLIVFEGLDGSGTTTQARRAMAYLERKEWVVHLTREPSDNPIGRLLREFLMGNHAIGRQEIDPETLALLFAADRMDHLQREVEPQLAAGRFVISDRWYHSSLAYQGFRAAHEELPEPFRTEAHHADLERVASFNACARRPDLTIFLQVDPAIAARRRAAAGRVQELFDDLGTQRRVESGYRAAIELVRLRGERVEIIDGEASVDEVSVRIAGLIDALLSEPTFRRRKACVTCGGPGCRSMNHAGWDPTADPQ